MACISSRATRIARPPELPKPRNREMMAAALSEFGANLLREISHPKVIAIFRLAIAETVRSPEIAQALDGIGRETTRRVLFDLFAGAQTAGLLGAGEPAAMARQYLGLLWEDLMIGLLLGVTATPDAAEVERRATNATAAFMQLHCVPDQQQSC